MRIFFAGASGALGRRLNPLLLSAHHDITGLTRSGEVALTLEAEGIHAAVADVYDADAIKRAAVAARPDVVIHQLTDLPRVLNDEKQLAAAYPRNARIRTEGTRNLVAAAKAAGARRFIVQSIAFAYAPRQRAPCWKPIRSTWSTGRACRRFAPPPTWSSRCSTSGMERIVLRYGLLYGPGTWSEGPGRKPSLHVDAAAQAAFLAVTRGNGIYNIADDDGTVSIDKARNELGFDPAFRLKA